MYTKYKIAPSKAVVGVDRPMKALSLHLQKPLKSQREITLIELAFSPYFFAISICPVNINVCARFDEILSMTLYRVV